MGTGFFLETLNNRSVYPAQHPLDDVQYDYWVVSGFSDDQRIAGIEQQNDQGYQSKANGAGIVETNIGKYFGICISICESTIFFSRITYRQNPKFQNS